MGIMVNTVTLGHVLLPLLQSSLVSVALQMLRTPSFITDVAQSRQATACDNGTYIYIYIYICLRKQFLLMTTTKMAETC
jgi:hypothetical protein